MVEHALDAAAKFAKCKEEEYRIQQMRLIHNIKAMMAAVDVDGDGLIAFDELEMAVEQNEMMADLLSRVDLPQNCTLKELYLLLDDSGDGIISPDEFEKDMYRLVQCNEFQRLCIMQMSLNMIKRMVTDVQKIGASKDGNAQEKEGSESNGKKPDGNGVTADNEARLDELRVLRDEMRQHTAHTAQALATMQAEMKEKQEDILLKLDTLISVTQRTPQPMSFPKETTPLQMYGGCCTKSNAPASKAMPTRSVLEPIMMPMPCSSWRAAAQSGAKPGSDGGDVSVSPTAYGG
eukprot:gnl/TRDRNA2_/TRDRNA2_162742_c3_seq1.p1 gnl/TRDRNA2_/TRDRNA2_162742_c3~~gnl/TRDRNA2_/TRDRNA2_162742_c3_seq1.p1  ORF type:complete len:291 (-),score=75.53 gnl/TRDRNA2_/TRDRNA2_162742_c3_seq1:220-1092(-)